MGQVQYSLLLRWFVGLAMDNEVWVPTVFTKNRQRRMMLNIATSICSCPSNSGHSDTARLMRPQRA